MPSSRDIVLGIDLGTTYSCAAYVQDGKPRIVPSEKGYTTVPSVVGLTQKGEIIVGHPAMDQMVVRPGETIYGSKRLVGRKYNSLVVQQMREAMTYQIVEGAGAEAAVMLGGKAYSLTQISAYILAEIKDMAQGMLQQEIKRAVITVPAYYSDNQRQAVKEAGGLAGLKVERIVNEPTAAAVAYGFNRGFNQRVLVFDLGGGTFDVSVLHVHGNEFKVLATGGDTFLGGVDFDIRITEYVLKKFQDASGKDLRGEKIAVQRVRAAAERAKRDLSLEKAVNVQLPYITEINGEPVDLLVNLSREQLNKLTVDLVDRTLKMCDEVLGTIQMKHGDLNEILLVGGQTRMPLVQNKIHQHFGKPPRKGVHPDEVVALGAALLGDPSSADAGVKLRDVLSIPIGIALPNGRFKVILERNIPIPASKAFKFTLDKKAPTEIDIYQGDEASILENEYLSTFSFPAPPKDRKGPQSLELRFELTPECLLQVRARDLESGKETATKMTTLQTPKSLRDSMAAAMADTKSEKSGMFQAFAKRILGK